MRDTEATPLVTTETSTWTGSGEGRCNEDFAQIDANGACAVLVDGATGLTKAHVICGESDAAWFARTLCEQAGISLQEDGLSVAQALCAAGGRVARAYRRHPGAAELRRIDEPNGSVALFRWDADHVEAALLGDATIVVLLRDGNARVLHDDTLTKLDEENYERMYAYAKERGTTMAQARKALNPRFIENRLKMNEPGGYWAADISCRGMGHVQTWAFATSQVQALFACSDGFAAAVDMGVASNMQELAVRVLAGEGAQVGEELRAAERADAGCWRVHRSKTSDDATYLLVSFC